MHEEQKKWVDRGLDSPEGICEVALDLAFEFGGTALKFLGHLLELAFELVVAILAGLFQ